MRWPGTITMLIFTTFLARRTFSTPFYSRRQNRSLSCTSQFSPSVRSTKPAPCLCRLRGEAEGQTRRIYFPRSTSEVTSGVPEQDGTSGCITRNEESRGRGRGQGRGEGVCAEVDGREEGAARTPPQAPQTPLCCGVSFLNSEKAVR